MRAISGIIRKRAKLGVGSTCLTTDQVTVLKLEPMKMHPVVLEVPGLNSTPTKDAVSESDIQRVAFDPETELPSLSMALAGLTLIASATLAAHAYPMTEIWTGALLLTVACSIELMSPALYNLLSSIIPVLMAVHLVWAGRVTSLMPLVAHLPISLLVIGVPMSVCLHRYFSHQAFSTTRPIQFVLGVVACLAWQGGPLWWAMMHRRHHQHCDKPEDPHSAKQRGVVYAFVGWMANPVNYRPENVDYSGLDQSMRTPEMMLVQKLNPLPPLLLCLVAKSYLGYCNMVCYFLAPMLNSRLTTLVFNVHFHPEEHDKAAQGSTNGLGLSLVDHIVVDGGHWSHMGLQIQGCKHQLRQTEYVIDIQYINDRRLQPQQGFSKSVEVIWS